MRFVVCGVGGWDLRCFSFGGSRRLRKNFRVTVLTVFICCLDFLKWNSFLCDVIALVSSDVHSCVALVSFQMSFAIRFDFFNWLLVQLIR